MVELGYLEHMTKKKTIEHSGFATSGGAATAPAKSTSLKAKASRSRKTSLQAETSTPAPAAEVALSPEAHVESTTRTAKAKTNSTAVTHRHKKLEIAPVAAVPELRVENSHTTLEPAPLQKIEPTNEEIAKLAYSYYIARGFQGGNQAEDWFRAVAELRAKLNP